MDGRFFPSLALVALALVVARPATAGEPYKIGPGDVLEISVWKNEALSRTLTVRPDGMISLPLVNDVQAAGVSPMDLRQTLIEKLKEYVPAAEVSVIVREARSFAVSIIGSVSKPGRYDLSGPTTVLDGLAIAGGLNEFASKGGIFVVRTTGEKSERLPFDYNDAIAGKSEAKNFKLRAGDVVVVP